MRITIERLRGWILVLACLLVAAILGFFAYTRFELGRMGRDLPGRLGVNIQQDANGFTYSKSQGGRTVFTLHASRLLQYKSGGRATLHNVTITLYGKDGSRSDRISGSDFEYDSARGIARALGDVHLEVQVPAGMRGTVGGDHGADDHGAEDHGAGDHPAAAGSRDAAARSETATAQSRILHAETSGLVFNRETGEARTDAPVRFTLADAEGTALGALYDSSKGLLILEHEVRVRAQLVQGSMLLAASHAEFNHDTRQLALLAPDLRYAGQHDTAEQALIDFRPDGTAEKVDARRNVSVVDTDGRQLHSSTLELRMDAGGQVQQAQMDGGVLFSAQEGPHSIHGDANSAVLHLGGDGVLRQVEMHKAVTVVDQEVGPAIDPHGSVTREVRGSTVVINLVNAHGSAQASGLLASGGAVLTEHTIYSNSPPQNTVIKGNEIRATLLEGRALNTLDAQGHTFLTNTNPSGVSQTSSGDTLHISFAQEPLRQARQRPNDIPPSLVEHAVQQGHVSIVQIKPAANGHEQPWRSQATAQVATLDGPRQIVHLEGSPRLDDAEAELTARTIDLYRISGAVTADGDVRVSLRQGATAQAPVHAIAAKVFFDHDRNEAILYGGAGDARLWQAANSVAAPTIVLDREHQVLIAPQAGRAGRVHAVLADPGSKAGGGQAVIRVDADRLQYSEAERRATFTGNIVAQQAEGSLRAGRAELFLSRDPGGAKTGPGQIPNPRGALDHMLVSEGVQVEEGVRKGIGDHILYTAAEGRYTLYGRPDAPARLSDPEHGTVAGSALIFTNRGDSVEVSGGASRATTDTEVSR